MKAITVKQPWASLMFIENGYQPKDIENRTWKTNFRGRVLIHAGATILRPQGLFTDDQWDNIRGDMRYKVLHSDLPTSAIIGSVEIVDCVINHSSIWAEKSEDRIVNRDGIASSHYFKTYNWVLANPILFPKPIPAKGKQSFWDYPNILAEPEEKNGSLFCHCNIPVDEETQVLRLTDGFFMCHYCGGRWYK